MEIKGKTTTAAPPEVTVPTPYNSYSTSTTTTTSLSPAAAQSSPSFPSPPSQSPPSPSAPHSPPPIVLSPCAACKILRRRCVDKCILAPYFPPTHPLKFTIAHRVFGASNIIKLLQVC